MEAVTDGVMLQREKRIQHTQADPPVAIDPGYFDTIVSGGKQAISANVQLAVLVGAYSVLGILITAIKLGAIPPVGCSVDKGRW